VIHVDTHVLVWLYAGEVSELTPLALELIEKEDIVASPMAALELDFLHEIRRIKVAGKEIIETLVAQLGLTLSTAPFPRIIERAASLVWTRDPFDRVIVANAMADGAQLLTKDSTILEHASVAVWERAKPKRKKR
jgi:PIN domain nuclease of toxin-antitoxin system